MSSRITIKYILLLAVFCLLAFPSRAQWLDGYSYRRAITVQPNQVPNGATLTDFPMLIDITGSYLLTTGNGGDITSANGYDIAFSIDHTTTLDHDIITYEGTTTGEYKAWVEVPSIQDGTIIYMYYGNASISADPSTSATWGNGYEGVWQLDDDFNDASPNGRNGTNNGSVDIPGVIEDGQDFEADDNTDRVDVGTFSVSGNALTISAWVAVESWSSTDGRILSKADGTGADDHWYSLSARRYFFSYRLRFRLQTGGSTTTLSPTSGTMNVGTIYYATAVYDGSDMMLYLNGTLVGSTPKSGNIDVDNSISNFIGNNPPASGGPFDGGIDQVTIASAARSADWIGAEFNNQGSPSSFYSVGSATTNFPGIIIIPSNAYVLSTGTYILLNGDLENNGSFTHNSGTVIFRGSDQAIDGTSATDFYNVTINNGSNTTINSSNQGIKAVLLCNGTLNTSGNLTLLSTVTQTALVDGSGSGSISGNITMQRYLPSGFGYHYFSSPFQAATVNEFGDDMDLGATFPTFYEYDESRTSSGWVDYTTSTNSLNPMEGYAVNFGDQSDPKTVDVTGTINDGSMQVTLYNNDNTYTQGFNLVGNPYPSPIDWDASSGWTKTNIDDALYFFEAGTTNQYLGTYSSYINGVSSDGVADNIISSMQGFFVHVSDGSYPVTGTLGFSNSVRTNDLAPAFFKSGITDSRPLVRINADFSDNQAPADPVVIYFDDETTRYFEPENDALKRMNTDTRVPNFYLYSQDTRRLSISGMPFPSDSIDKVPVGLITEQDGWISFYASEKEMFPNDLHAYLVDAETGITHNLKDDHSYDIYLDAGEYNSRFYLVFSEEEWTNPFGAKELFTINRNGDQVWVVINLQFGENGVLRMINAQGQLLMTREVFGNEVVYINGQVSSGVYIMSLFSSQDVYSKKLLMP
jgi:hypothetical protein